jgi:hypothetical protein
MVPAPAPDPYQQAKIVRKTLIPTRNGNASETKANESFDNGVFFDIKAKSTPSIVSKIFWSETNTLDRKKILFEAKRTRSIVRKLFSTPSEHVRQSANYFRSEANTLDRKKILLKRSEHIR